MLLLFTNAKALESANVEAVVVFRTLSIFVTAYGDFKLLKVKALDMNSIGALGLVILGAIGYVLMDRGTLTDLTWHSPIVAFVCAPLTLGVHPMAATMHPTLTICIISHCIASRRVALC